MENMEHTLELAVKDFLRKNNLKEDNIKVTVLDPASKAIIRVFNGNVQMLRNAEKTIYHGSIFDIFSFLCTTGKSGILEYDEVSTDEYRFKCAE